jgi:hypothetical protein
MNGPESAFTLVQAGANYNLANGALAGDQDGGAIVAFPANLG